MRDLNEQEQLVIDNLWIEVLLGKKTKEEYFEEIDKIINMIANNEDIFI